MILANLNFNKSKWVFSSDEMAKLNSWQTTTSLATTNTSQSIRLPVVDLLGGRQPDRLGALTSTWLISDRACFESSVFLVCDCCVTNILMEGFRTGSKHVTGAQMACWWKSGRVEDSCCCCYFPLTSATTDDCPPTAHSHLPCKLEPCFITSLPCCNAGAKGQANAPAFYTLSPHRVRNSKIKNG